MIESMAYNSNRRQINTYQNGHTIRPDIISSIHNTNNTSQHLGSNSTIQNTKNTLQHPGSTMHSPYTALSDQYNNHYIPYSNGNQSIPNGQNPNASQILNFNHPTNSSSYNQSMPNFYQQSSMLHFNQYTNSANFNDGHLQNQNQHGNVSSFNYNYVQNPHQNQLANMSNFRHNHMSYTNQNQHLNTNFNHHCMQNSQNAHQTQHTNFNLNHMSNHDHTQQTHMSNLNHRHVTNYNNQANPSNHSQRPNMSSSNHSHVTEPNYNNRPNTSNFNQKHEANSNQNQQIASNFHHNPIHRNNPNLRANPVAPCPNSNQSLAKPNAKSNANVSLANVNKAMVDTDTCVSNVNLSVSNVTPCASNVTPCERKANAIETRKRSTCRRGSSLCKIDEETNVDEDKDSTDEDCDTVDSKLKKSNQPREINDSNSENSNEGRSYEDFNKAHIDDKVNVKVNVKRKNNNQKETVDSSSEDSDAYNSSLASDISLNTNEDLRSDDEGIRTDNDCEELEEDVEVGDREIVAGEIGPKGDGEGYSVQNNSDNSGDNNNVGKAALTEVNAVGSGDCFDGNGTTERDSAIEDTAKSVGPSSNSTSARVRIYDRDNERFDKDNDTSGVVSANVFDDRTDDEVSSNLEDSDLDDTKSIPTSEVGSEEEEALMEELEIDGHRNRKGNFSDGLCQLGQIESQTIIQEFESKKPKTYSGLRPSKGAFVKVPPRSKSRNLALPQETIRHSLNLPQIITHSPSLGTSQNSNLPLSHNFNQPQGIPMASNLSLPQNMGHNLSPSQLTQRIGHNLSSSNGMSYPEMAQLSPSQSLNFSQDRVHNHNLVPNAAPVMINQEMKCACQNCHARRPDILANIQNSNNIHANVLNEPHPTVTNLNHYNGIERSFANNYQIMPNGSISSGHVRNSTQVPNWNQQNYPSNFGNQFNLPQIMPEHCSPHEMGHNLNMLQSMSPQLNQPRAVENRFNQTEVMRHQPQGMGHHLNLMANESQPIHMMGLNLSPVYNGVGIPQDMGHNYELIHEVEQSNLCAIPLQPLQGAQKQIRSSNRNEKDLDITSETECTEESENESDDIGDLVQKRKLEEVYSRLDQKIHLFNSNYLRSLFQTVGSQPEEVTSFGKHTAEDELIDNISRLQIQEESFSREHLHNNFTNYEAPKTSTHIGNLNEYNTLRSEVSGDTGEPPVGLTFAPNLENLIGFPTFEDVQRPQEFSNQANSAVPTHGDPLNSNRNLKEASTRATNVPDSALDNALSSCEFAHVWNDLDKTKSELNVVLFDVDTACERINELKQLINLKNNLLKFLMNNKALREDVRAKVDAQSVQLKAKVRSLKRGLYELRHMEEKRNIDKLNMKYKKNRNGVDANKQLMLFNHLNRTANEEQSGRKSHKRMRKHSEQEGSTKIVELVDNPDVYNSNNALPWLERPNTGCLRPDSALSVSTCYNELPGASAVLPMEVIGDPVSSTETNMAANISRLKREIDMSESRLHNLSVITKVTLQSDEQIEELSKNLCKWTKRLTTFEKLIENEKTKKEQLKNDLVLNLYKIRSMEETFNRDRQKSDVLSDISALIERLKPMALLDVIKRDTDVSSSDKTIVTNTPMNGSESKSGSNTLKRNTDGIDSDVKRDTIVCAVELNRNIVNPNEVKGNKDASACDTKIDEHFNFTSTNSKRNVASTIEYKEAYLNNIDVKKEVNDSDSDLKRETNAASDVKRSSSDKTVVLNTLMNGSEKKLDNLLETESSFDTMGSSSMRNYKMTASTEISDNAISVTAVSDKSGGVGSNNETKRKKKSSLSRAFSFRKSHNTVNSSGQCASTERSAEKPSSEKPEKSTTGKKIKNFILNKSGDKNKSNDSIRFKKPDDQVSNCSSQSNQRVNGREDDKLSNSSLASKLRVIVENNARDVGKVSGGERNGKPSSDERIPLIETSGENGSSPDDHNEQSLTSQRIELQTSGQNVGEKSDGNRTANGESCVNIDSNVAIKKDGLRVEIAKLLELKHTIVEKRMKLFPNKCSDQSELNRKLFFEYDETIETIDVLVEHKGNLIRELDDGKDRRSDFGSYIANALKNSGESSRSNGRSQYTNAPKGAKNLPNGKSPNNGSAFPTNNDLYHTLIDKLINLNYNELILVVYKYFNRIIDLRSTSVELEKLVQSLDYKLEIKIAHEQEMNLKFERLHQNNQISNEKHLTQLQKDYQNKLHLFYRCYCTESVHDGAHVQSASPAGGDNSFLLREENKFLKSKLKHLESQLRKMEEKKGEDAVAPFKTFVGLNKTITMENNKLVIANRH